MASSVKSRGIILLFERYTLMSQYLHASLLRSGYQVPAIVLEENDFLPEGVVSVYDLIVGNYKDGQIENSGKPRYFNEIAVPDTWSISAEEEKWGRISYQRVEKGRIYYAEPAKDLLVKMVEWYDRKGTIRFCDHYNRFGDICARTVCNAGGEAVSKSWLSPAGHEIAVENYATGNIVFNEGEGVRIFHSKIELALHCFRKLGLDRKRIFVNTLSEPFFLSNQLKASPREDVLFLQEGIAGGDAEKMRMVLEGKSGSIGKIILQTQRAYDCLQELGLTGDKVQELGFIYPFQKENHHSPEALICTNSDRIEHCEELIQALPQMHFHIAALTWMSQKLFDLGQYSNVSLYPGAQKEIQEELFKKCDYYFDINHRNEIIDAVYQAFLHNHLIFAFQETVHNREYVADAQIYSVEDFGSMVTDIHSVMEQEHLMQKCLESQHKHAMAESGQAYRDLLGL